MLACAHTRAECEPDGRRRCGVAACPCAREWPRRWGYPRRARPTRPGDAHAMLGKHVSRDFREAHRWAPVPGPRRAGGGGLSARGLWAAAGAPAEPAGVRNAGTYARVDQPLAQHLS